VEGLSGKVEIGKSGKITHKGLDYYVSERVHIIFRLTPTPPHKWERGAKLMSPRRMGCASLHPSYGATVLIEWRAE